MQSAEIDTKLSEKEALTKFAEKMIQSAKRQFPNKSNTHSTVVDKNLNKCNSMMDAKSII